MIRCSSHTCPHAEPCAAFVRQAVRHAKRRALPVGVVPTIYGWAVLPDVPASGYAVEPSGRVIGHERTWTNDGPESSSWVVLA